MVSRERRPSRHRATPDRPAATMVDEELESYLAAISPRAESPSEAHPDGTSEMSGTAQVFQVRLPGRQIDQVRRIAEARGVSPHTLLVDWVLERLEWEEAQAGSRVPRAPIAPHSPTTHHPTWPSAAHSASSHAPGAYHGPALAGARIGTLSDPSGPTRFLAPHRSAPLGHAAPARPPKPLDPLAPAASRPERSARPYPPGMPADTSLPPLASAHPYPRVGQPTRRWEQPPALGDAPRSGPGSWTPLADALAPFADVPLAESGLGDPVSRRLDSWTPVADALSVLSSDPLTGKAEQAEAAADAPTDEAGPGDQARADETPAESESKPRFGQVTPIFRAGMELPNPDEHRGPRHRAPEPVTSLLTRRKF